MTLEIIQIQNAGIILAWQPEALYSTGVSLFTATASAQGRQIESGLFAARWA